MYLADNKQGILEIYSDSDFANDLFQRSTPGFVCKYADCAIMWKSKKQQSISMSTTKAEFMAASEATKKFYGLSNFLMK